MCKTHIYYFVGLALHILHHSKVYTPSTLRTGQHRHWLSVRRERERERERRWNALYVDEKEQENKENRKNAAGGSKSQD